MNYTTLIDVDSLRAVSTRVVLLDCRFELAAPAAGRQAYLTAHIPGARYVDLNQDLAAPVAADSGRHPLPSPGVLAGRFAALGVTDTAQVIAYDDANGAFAARAWWLLRWLGHARVAVLDGGFNAWVAGGGALESHEPAPAVHGPAPAAQGPATAAVGFTPQVDARAVLTATEVLHALQDPARLVVDARAAERYSGSIEPIDPVAGHIPGAVNHPFTENLGPRGQFLTAAELRRRWQQRLAGIAPANAILMCGSGVTACHDLLALEIAGLPGAKLYAGSWSEWIRDPERPIARGFGMVRAT